MRKELKPVKKFGGTISVPGDKSIAHRAVLLSLLSKEPITIKNFPDNADCRASLEAAKTFGVEVVRSNGELTLTPSGGLVMGQETIIECGNSGTTARLLAGIIAGSELTAILAGDESLSKRPMDRIVKPLTQMGAEFFAENEGFLPLKVSGRKLLPFDYEMTVPSAQVKSALLMAGLASGCSVTIREKVITRDHTERMIEQLGGRITVHEVKPVLVPDPVDPRKKKMSMPESYKKEISLAAQERLAGGVIDIPGDFSTAAFFMGAAAISGKKIAIKNVGLNPTRTAFVDILRQMGCKIEISDRRNASGEPRGNITVEGGELKPKKIQGDLTAALIDEIPILSVVAGFAEGTTVIRDAGELKLKESDRLAAIAHNLGLMGVKCGVLEDGLAIEGRKELSGADFGSFGDHRIAMAMAVASMFLVGPSTIDDASCVDVSCPEFFELLEQVST